MTTIMKTCSDTLGKLDAAANAAFTLFFLEGAAQPTKAA